MALEQNRYGYRSASPYGSESAAPRRPADARPMQPRQPAPGYGAEYGGGYSSDSYGGYDPRSAGSAYGAQQQPRASYAPPYARPSAQQRPNAPPRQSASAAPRRSVDMLLLLLMFIVGPLCGVLGVFLRPMLWAFLVVEGISIALMWLFKCYLLRGRIMLTTVLLVLMTLALLAGVDLGGGQRNYQSYGAQSGLDTQQAAAQNNDTPWSGVSGLGLGGLTSDANAPASPEETPAEEPLVAAANLEGAAAPVEPQYPVAEATASPMTGVLSAAEAVMTSYLQGWKDANWDSMAQCATPTWRSAQANPARQLFWNHGLWTLESWTMTAQNAGLNSDSITFSILTDLSKKNSTTDRMTKRFEGIVIKDEDGTWYVDPDSMRTGIEVKESASDLGASNAAVLAEDSALAPQLTVSNSDNMQQSQPNVTLWYNSKGGSFYHLEEKCASINSQYYSSMKSFSYSELNDSPYSKLKPCKTCGAPDRP